MEDRDLALAAAKGDSRAFAVLFERYRRYVYSIAHRVLLDEEEALDAAQSAWAKAAERIGQYGGRGTFRGWLAAVAAREAIDRARKRARSEKTTEGDDLPDLGDRGSALAPDIRERIDGARERERVEVAMRVLSPQQRAILALQLLEDLGPKEIAERLGIPDKQVRSQLRRAIVRLREMLRV